MSEDLTPTSKTQRKKIMHDLQSLGAELIKLNATDLAKIPLSDALKDSIAQIKKTPMGNGKRRLLQYIGKLLSKTDSQAIIDAYENIDKSRKNSAKHFQKLEQLRNHLVENGQEAIEELLTKYPQADRQLLRQYVRKAQQEKTHEKPPIYQRKLFRYLRELNENN